MLMSVNFKGFWDIKKVVQKISIRNKAIVRCLIINLTNTLTIKTLKILNLRLFISTRIKSKKTDLFKIYYLIIRLKLEKCRTKKMIINKSCMTVAMK